MTIFKKPRAALVSMVALSACTSVFAAREAHLFEVSVTVPEQSFYVIPAEPDWIHRQQQLPWNLVTSTLGGLRKYFDVRNDAGAIEARLEGRAYLSNGTAAHDIDLRVLFNGKELRDGISSEVVSLADAALGKRVLLEILPTPPADNIYKPGSYFGNANIIFNAVMP
jgi:hypothetical protein